MNYLLGFSFYVLSTKKVNVSRYETFETELEIRRFLFDRP